MHIITPASKVEGAPVGSGKEKVKKSDQDFKGKGFLCQLSFSVLLRSSNNADSPSIPGK